MMKKILATLMALLLALVTLAAFAEDSSFIPSPEADDLMDVATLSGYVMDVQESHILPLAPEGLFVEALLTFETVTEGAEVLIGDFVHVTYNGIMTMSLPGQIAALKIGCYTHTGEISDLGETSFVLNTALEPVIVNASAELLAGLENGMTVTVYSNGAMAMSLPAQIGAEMIVAVEAIAD